MKTVFKGEILKLNTKEDYDFIIINETKIGKNSFYQFSNDYEINYLADNKSTIIYKPDFKLVVKFIKQINIESNLGILKFWEFNEIKNKKDKVVHFDIYNVISPFSIKQYFDGSYIMLELIDVKISYNITCTTYIQKIETNKYKIPHLKNVCILFYSENFSFRYKPKLKTKYPFNILKYNGKTQINIYVNKIKEYQILDFVTKFKNSIFKYENKEIILKNEQEDILFDDGILIYNKNGNKFKKNIGGYDFVDDGNFIFYNDMKLFVR